MRKGGECTGKMMAVSLIFFMVIIIIAIPVNALDYTAKLPNQLNDSNFQTDNFNPEMKEGKQYLCEIPQYEEYRIGSTPKTDTLVFGRNYFPKIEGDMVAWWEFEHDGGIWREYIRTFNLTSRNSRTFDGLTLTRPAIDGNLVAYGENDHIILYDLPSDQKTSVPGRGLVSEVAVGGNRLVWISSANDVETIFSRDRVSGTETILQTVSGNNALTDLKISGDKAVWSNYYGGKNPYIQDPAGTLSFPPESKSTIVATDFSKKQTKYLSSPDPAVNQTDPDIDGDYIVWLESRPESEFFKDVIIYSTKTESIVKKIQAKDPSPPVLSGNRVAWADTDGIHVYDFAYDKGDFFTPPHYNHQQKFNRAYNYFDISGDYLVYAGPSVAGSYDTDYIDVYLYKIAKTTCITPSMEVNPPDGYAPLSVTFDASKSTSYSGKINSYAWVILKENTPQILNGPQITMTFDTPGVCDVKLIVTDTEGHEANTSQKIFILNPDEAKITKDPDWNSYYPQIHGDFMCWIERYASDNYDLTLNKELQNGTVRAVGYNIRTGERRVLGTETDVCSVGENYIATIGKEVLFDSYKFKDVLTVYSLPDMKPVVAYPINYGRSLRVSGSQVIWEDWTGRDAPSVNTFHPLPVDMHNPPTIPGISGCSTSNGNNYPDYQGDVMLLDLTYQIKGVKPGYTNITHDQADNNWPKFEGDTVIWVDYYDMRTWPDKVPVLWAQNITTNSKLKIPTTAVQISPVIYGDLVIWDNLDAESRKTACSGGLNGGPWTETLQEYNLTTNKQRTLKTFTLDQPPEFLSLLGDRILWAEASGKIIKYDPTTDEKNVLVDRGEGSGVTIGGFDQYCNLIAFSDNRGGIYNIYLNTIPQNEDWSEPQGCQPYSIHDSFQASLQKTEAPSGTGIWWNPIQDIIDIFMPPPPVSQRLPGPGAVSLADNGSGTQPTSFVIMISSVPQAVMSVIHLTPVSGIHEAETIPVAEALNKSSDNQQEASIQVVVLPERDKQYPEPLHEAGKVVPIVNPLPPDQQVIYTKDVVKSDPDLSNVTPSSELQIDIPETFVGREPTIVSYIPLSCPAGHVTCNGQCVDLMTDTAYCGSCYSTCSSQFTCVAGVCTPQCSSDQTLCNGACTSLLTDPNNCGVCGNICTLGTCENGQCVARMATTQPTENGKIGMTRQHL